MYIKINGGTKKYYVTVMPFTTQHGYPAIRFIGDEIPNTKKGLKLYSEDDDSVISDYSDYTYMYQQNEFSTEEDIIQYGIGSDVPLPESLFNKLNRRVSRMNSQLNAVTSQVDVITPYTESKIAYIGDTECDFFYSKEGNISAWITTGDIQTPCKYEVIDATIRVLFDELEEVATVNISIQ